MLEVRKSITLSGTITVEQVTAGGTPNAPIVYMSASIGEDGKPSVSKNIQDTGMYFTHKEEIKKNIAEFEDMVENLM